ncbi:SctD/MshK family protein [Rhizobium grahamii]|uniref:YscD/Y4YQ C-terminal domain-containing protein n=1 Tax=Rhizobium grahamii TaxID=1120045 RepID=A0A370KE78_9HYPH|nr:hypothetical protein [Rhizobium grahamii]RDJ01006.1 hypothetical protein B5K06_34280 [Rhizobium grahamii]
MDDCNSLHFEVLSGLYSGLTDKAAMGTTIIGSGHDADLVFVEQGLEAHHVRISLLGASIEVEALAPGTSLEGHGIIAVGERVVAAHPVVIYAGEMSILWRVKENEQATSVDVSRLMILVLAIVLLSCIGIGIGSYDRARSLTSPVAEVVSKPTFSRPDNLTIQATAKDLQKELIREGLLNIKVGCARGVVTTEGTVTPALVSRWQKARQWFDHRSNGSLILVDGVVVKDETAPPTIAVEGVWRGALPYLLISGQKYFAGALLDDGWTVDRIESGRAMLSKNGQIAVLHY